MNICEFFKIAVLALDRDTVLCDFLSATQEVIINSATYNFSTHKLSTVCLGPLLRLSQVSKGVVKSAFCSGYLKISHCMTSKFADTIFFEILYHKVLHDYCHIANILTQLLMSGLEY